MTPSARKPHQTVFTGRRNAMMIHEVRVDCCQTTYFVYGRSHSARRWRLFFAKSPNHFQVVAQSNSRTSHGQASSVIASIWFCKYVDQDHFAKFATTTSQRCPTLENDMWETHLGFLQLRPQRQQYSRQYGHFFVSLVRQHFVLLLWIQIFPLDAQLLIC